MSQRNERNRNNNNEEGGWNTAAIVGGVLGGLAAVAGAGWWFTRGSGDSSGSANNNTESQSASSRSPPQPTRTNMERHQQDQGSNMSDYLASVMERMNTNSGGGSPSRRGVPRSSVPDNPSITNLNSLLDDIYKRFIALNDEDFETYYSVMHDIFRQIHYKMMDVEPYYKKYSSTIQYAGSHPDRLRINKPDEFDVDIVIGLPLCYQTNPSNPDESDFTFEPKDPGFVQLKMGVQYDRLPYRDHCEWHINKVAYEWRDEKNYLLRSKFMDWFKSVVNRALNEFKVGNSESDPIFYVQGVPYKISKSESGPAMTLYVENSSKNFKLDVDLVPALRFPIGRWPVCSGYRLVPPRCAGKGYWMVVPKPNKSGQNDCDKTRSWRVALHEQEGMLMHGTNHMRQAIRLIKKLRDAKGMDKIASYYIKTLFFWEAMERESEREFWNNNPAFIFKYMLKKFHQALVAGNIPYFWNKKNNLIGNVPRSILNHYAKIIGELLEVLEIPSDYKKVAKYLLTGDEFKQYEKYLNI